jgi:hypothetical protein
MNIKPLRTVEEILGKDVVKRGNWTEERKEALKHLTHDDIAAAILRLQAEHPESLLTPEEIKEMATQVQQTQVATRRTELVSA